MASVKEVPPRPRSRTAAATRPVSSRRPDAPALEGTVFETPLGWSCILGRGTVLHRLVFGYHSADALLADLQDYYAGDLVNSAWNLPLVGRVQAFFHGLVDDFRDVPIPRARSPFVHAVRTACRKIPPGCTLTYKELATRAGRPGASRAVGAVMAGNPLPIVVPCHRVVGSGGRLGGYSAPGGLATKSWLLAWEASSLRKQGSGAVGSADPP